MDKVIIIRVGELFLKGNNKRYFEDTLSRNIRKALDGIKCYLRSARNRFIVENYAERDHGAIIMRLQKIFGIHSVSPAIKIHADLDEISRVAAEISPKAGKFRVSVNKADKTIQKRSMDIAADVGQFMLKNSKDLTVDLFKYDFEVNIDIREDKTAFIFYERLEGAGGLPSGCGGKAMLLLSGGIDSPVAGHKIARRGVQLFAVHYHSFPYTSEKAKQKVIDLAKTVSKYSGDIELSVVPFTEIQYAIREKCPIEFMITLMRRFMMRIAERLAISKGCGALVTGESLGQVASQTMESIIVTNDVVKLPVFRPLIGSDKYEIIEDARNIETYDLSILPYEDCCTVFLPKNPVIKPRLSIVEDMEKLLDIELLVEGAIARTETIICSSY
ncbi:MAG: tRNA 4-thiouridine(8) synthase ThiI [Clostridia bacterium]|nr:tRNA 4-thiouridine(8) synthase ThiI [Clostridia bacterium]